MQRKEMAQVSRGLSSLRKSTEALTGFHAYRYIHFVDSSPQKEECRYAKATLDQFNTSGEQEKLKDILENLQHEIGLMLEIL